MSDVSVPIDVRIQQYISLRDRKKELEAAHKEAVAPINKAMDLLEALFLKHFQATGVDSLAARGVGTVYKTVRKSASLSDADAFRRFVIGGEHWGLLDWKVNANQAEAFMEENGDLPPGVSMSRMDDVGVRRA